MFENIVTDKSIKGVGFKGELSGRSFDELGLRGEFFSLINGIGIIINAGSLEVVSEIAGAAANV